ncbi:MAG: hypothetical protein ACLQQ4_04750 [Bacteroidia bacterium]
MKLALTVDVTRSATACTATYTVTGSTRFTNSFICRTSAGYVIV